jgi:hypothetical protein
MTPAPTNRTARDELALAKYEGLGNDFLVVIDLGGRVHLDARTARLVCDRHRGFGADGLLRAGPVKTGRQKTGRQKTGRQKTGRQKTGRQKTGRQKTGRQKK